MSDIAVKFGARDENSAAKLLSSLRSDDGLAVAVAVQAFIACEKGRLLVDGEDRYETNAAEILGRLRSLYYLEKDMEKLFKESSKRARR